MFKMGMAKAAAGGDSLDEQSREIQDAWQHKHPSPRMQPMMGSWVVEVFADHIIVDDCGTLYNAPYTKDPSTSEIVFGAPFEVEMQYVPVAGGEWLATASDGKRFSEFPFEFMAPPDSIQVLPKPGTYHHPKYGNIDITTSDLEEFVVNFEAGVYGQDVPIEIDFEHSEGDLAEHGAVGYIRGLAPINSYKGGVEAEIEWTERGKTALESDAYKCFSPEWYDEWKQPTTGKTYRNVLIGGALTTRPFFKDDALKPLAASEGSGGLRVYIRKTFATKTDDGEEYPAEAYLVVPDPDKVSEWKLRVWENPTDKVTRAQLGRAAAALGPGGFRGQRVQLSPEERKLAITKLLGLYRSLDVPDEEIPRQIKASLAGEGYGEHEISAALKEFGMPDVEDVHVPSMVKLKRGDKSVEIQLTVEQRQALTEGKELVLTEDQLKALEPKGASERIAATEDALHKATERLEAVERERATERAVFRTRRFTEIVQGRAQGTLFDGPAFVGEVAKHVGTMEVLADAKGEDSEPFKDYVQMQQAHAEQIRASALFAEVGHPGNGSAESAEAEVSQKAKAKGGDFGAAVQAVLKENPVLARRYTEERNQRARIK